MMLWLVWLGVSVVGLTWAGWFGHFPFGFPTIGGTATLGSAVVGAVFGTVGAAVVALAQWLVLRRALAISAWWILATMAGIAVMHAFGDPLGDSGRVPLISPEFALVAALGGLVIGTLQYAVLRSRLSRAAWWIPASTASWAVGVTAGLALVAATGLGGLAYREGHTLAGAVAGVFVGAITGALLTYFQSQTRSVSHRGVTRSGF
jgi:hypothetical protein